MDLSKIFIEKLLYPAMETVKHNKTRKITSEFIRNQHKSEYELKDMQRDKLIKLLRYSFANVPAYKDCKASESEIISNPFRVLSSLPVLTKDVLRSNADQYISRTADRNKMIANISGGSTGEAVRFFMDRTTVEHYEAARWRGLSWYGISFGSRSVMLWGNPIELSRASERRYMLKERYLKNRILIPAYDLSPEKIDEYIYTINKFKPEYIYGYSSSLEAFGGMLLKHGRQHKVQLKAVVSTAETLFDYQREIIEKAFGCVCVNEYGARDGGIIAYQCPNGSMHVASENLVLEVLDPVTLDPVFNGEPGIAVITDLNNFSMPRLRYSVGDVVTISRRPCSCCRPMLTIEDINGREDALLVRPDGSMVHGHLISHLARKNTIVSYQLVEHSQARATLYVVKGLNKEENVNAFAQSISNSIGGIPVEISYVDELKPSKSGKFRYTIREFGLRNEQRDALV